MYYLCERTKNWNGSPLKIVCVCVCMRTPLIYIMKNPSMMRMNMDNSKNGIEWNGKMNTQQKYGHKSIYIKMVTIDCFKDVSILYHHHTHMHYTLCKQE